MATSAHTKLLPQVPTALTVSRIVCSILMLLSEAFSTGFFLLYFWCGLSDVLDGAIARKTKNETDLGAKLDSIADLVFSIALLLVLFKAFTWELWMYIWIDLIIVIRVLALVVGIVKFHTFSSLHSYANKAAGVTLFLLPLMYWFAGLPLAVVIACLIFTFSAVEELIILMRMEELDRNTRGVFF